MVFFLKITLKDFKHRIDLVLRIFIHFFGGRVLVPRKANEMFKQLVVVDILLAVKGPLMESCSRQMCSDCASHSILSNVTILLPSKTCLSRVPVFQ